MRGQSGQGFGYIRVCAFCVRVDVGVNVLESIVFQRSPTVELVLSLNDLFKSLYKHSMKNQSKLQIAIIIFCRLHYFLLMIIFLFSHKIKKRPHVQKKRLTKILKQCLQSTIITRINHIIKTSLP